MSRGNAALASSKLPGCGMVVVIAGATLFVVAIIGLFLSGLVVPAGHVGVVTTFGKVDTGVLYPGFHLRFPFAQVIHQVDVRVQPLQFKEIDAASMEQQTVKLTGMLNYHLNPEQADDIFQTIGLDFDDKVVIPALSNFAKEVVPQYPVTQILAKRDEIRARTQKLLAANLERYGISIDDVYVSNISFSSEYQEAIETKQTAQQNAEKETQILAQRRIQAEQLVVQAKGEGDAAIERARGEAESNRVRTASLSDALVRYLTITKWDGRLPTVTGGAVPLVDLGTTR